MSMLLLEENLEPEDIYCVNVDNDQVFTEAWLQDCIRTAGSQLASVKKALNKPLARQCAAAELPQALTGLPLAAHWNCKEPGVFGRIGLPFPVWVILGGCPCIVLVSCTEDRQHQQVCIRGRHDRPKTSAPHKAPNSELVVW